MTVPESVSYPSKLTIGSADDNDIVLRKGTISRHHAVLTVLSMDNFLIEDNPGQPSKHGISVQLNGSPLPTQIKRKYVGRDDTIYFAEHGYLLEAILPASLKLKPKTDNGQVKTDFTAEFASLQHMLRDYRLQRKQIKNREKEIRLLSIILAAVIGVSAAYLGRDKSWGWLTLLSSAGIGVLVPTLASTLLGTEDKLEELDNEHRQRYRCPNRPTCPNVFGQTPWDELVHQKNCPRCRATWIG